MYKLHLYLVLTHLVLGAILDHPFSRTTPLIGPLPFVPTVVQIKGSTVDRVKKQMFNKSKKNA